MNPFEEKIRRNLSSIAVIVPRWTENLRGLHLDANLVEDDWLRTVFSQEDIDFHERYLVEYRRETILTGKPSEIVFSDSPCVSSFLTDLKRERLAQYGDVEKLHRSPSTRPFLQLTRPAQRLSKSSERITPNDMREFHERQVIAARRLEIGKATYYNESTAILRNLASYSTEKTALEALFASILKDGIGKFSRSISYEQHGNNIPSVAIPIGTEVELVLALIVRPATNQQYGQLTIGWRICSVSQGKEQTSFVLHVDELLPFGRYSDFATRSDLGLNLIAQRERARIISTSITQFLTGGG